MNKVVIDKDLVMLMKNNEIANLNKTKNNKNKEIVKCDRCGEPMEQERCEGTFGIRATIFKCPKCRYQYEIGYRYNPFAREYVKYYKYY
jgi:uncharacterized protein with PIN domain